MTDSEDVTDPATFHERLDGAAEDLEAAETESDLDAVEETLDGIRSDLEAATLPEPEPPDDEDEEEAPDPAEELEERLDDLEDGVDDQRGPYAETAIEAIEDLTATVKTTEWAEEGETELAEATATFLSSLGEQIDVSIEAPAADPEAVVRALEAATAAIEDAGLHPDDDAATITGLIDTAETFADAVEAATAFGDLPVREQLHRQGFFDVLGHYTDFPAEWSAIKAHEEAGNVEMILLAHELLDSNFLEEHCLDALRRLGDERALEPMMNLAQRRDQQAIAVLGKIASDEPVDMLLEYVETGGDPALQKATMKALGEIGSRQATAAVAQQVAAENPAVRSAAARSLGMIGDPRAIEPLANVLANDEAEHVRGSAAWALVQIGTERALTEAGAYTDDRSYLVEAEAAKAATVEETA